MPTDLSRLKVAIVHDWLVSARGGERVLNALCELFPQAEIFTLFHEPGTNSPQIENRVIHTSFLNRLPLAKRFYRHLLPLFPLAIEQMSLKDFDLVLSSSHCVSKGVIPPPGALHVSYCYTTMRYAWDQSEQYFGSGWKRTLVAPFLHYLRMWDVTSSARVDHFVAISQFISKRIEKYYRRKSEVIYPFVDLQRFAPVAGERGDYYLVVSAFAPYKRIELAVQACERLGRQLIVVGDGQDAPRLKSLGGSTTRFLGNLPDAELPDLFAGAKAVLFPGIEDFGIVPLEAMASGTPVIAYGKGGASETVVDGVTGVFFHDASVDGMAKAIERFESLPKFSPTACRERAEFFSKARFQNELLGLLGKLLNQQADADHASSPRSPDMYV